MSAIAAATIAGTARVLAAFWLDELLQARQRNHSTPGWEDYAVARLTLQKARFARLRYTQSLPDASGPTA
jgi:hypothetical protein